MTPTLTAREKFMAAAKSQKAKAAPEPVQAPKKPRKPRIRKKVPYKSVQAPIPDGYASHLQIAELYGLSKSAVSLAVHRRGIQSKPWGRYAIVLLADWEEYQASIPDRLRACAENAKQARIAHALERRLAKSTTVAI